MSNCTNVMKHMIISTKTQLQCHGEPSSILDHYLSQLNALSPQIDQAKVDLQIAEATRFGVKMELARAEADVRTEGKKLAELEFDFYTTHKVVDALLDQAAEHREVREKLENKLMRAVMGG